MSKIQWTEQTWNPVTGCTKVSEGCAHCYAEGVANRFWGDRKFGDVQFHPERLEQPLRRRKPTMYFVNSMSDLFHEDISFEVIAAILGIIAITPHHTYQILTKRPYRMLEFFSWLRFSDGDPWTECHFQALQNDNEAEVIHKYDAKPTYEWPLPNLWLGVTCENQRTADERIPLLLQTPAAVRFLSCEPLLEAVDIDFENIAVGFVEDQMATVGWDQSKYGMWEDFSPSELLHWVIVGGESGAKARPCDIAWIRSIVEQCKEAEVPCFVKQLGSKPVETVATGLQWDWGATKGKGGNPDEWPEDLRVREYPKALQPT